MSNEEIDNWYNSLPIREKFNGWSYTECPQFELFTEEDWKQYEKTFQENKRKYYNRLHGIKEKTEEIMEGTMDAETFYSDIHNYEQ